MNPYIVQVVINRNISNTFYQLLNELVPMAAEKLFQIIIVLDLLYYLFHSLL